MVRLVRLSLQMLITGEAGFSDMSGPVGIVSTITTVGEQSENARAAAANIAYLAAFIAVNLAVMNPAAPARSGRRQDFLPGGQRPVPAHHPQADPRQV